MFVLAVCLGGGWATAIVLSASPRTPPITDSTKDLLSSVGGVLAGAITAYIGGTIALKRHRKGEGDSEDPEEDPDKEIPT